MSEGCGARTHPCILRTRYGLVADPQHLAAHAWLRASRTQRSFASARVSASSSPAALGAIPCSTLVGRAANGPGLGRLEESLPFLRPTWIARRQRLHFFRHSRRHPTVWPGEET